MSEVNAVKVVSEKNPSVAITTANVHDSKVAYPLIAGLSAQYGSIEIIKADNGYKGKLTETIKEVLSIDMQCVKSNYGTSGFLTSF